MPHIIRQDGTPITAAAEINAILHALRLTVAQGESTPSDVLRTVLNTGTLSPDQAEHLLDEAKPVIGGLYQGADVIALFPQTPDLDRLEALFRRPHRHSDDEIRYILAGQGIFGFVLPDGGQVEITVAAGDLIGVPAGAEHWFRLGMARSIVAIRLFGDNPDWRADFTDTEVKMPQT